MLIIEKPYLCEKDDRKYLISHVKDEAQNIEEDLWYATDKEYAEYLAVEVADAFLIGLLQPAIKYNQAIKINAPISERIAYNLNEIKHIIGIAQNNTEIADNLQISYEGYVNVCGKTCNVGCGCSLGVDSFAAMLEHLSSNCPSEHRITHFTYFNVGAMGYVNLQQAKESYEKDLKLVKAFAKKLNIPVVCLESNISKWHKDFDFDDSGHFRNMSAILSIQKLFRRYLYASSFSVDDFQYNSKLMGYYESLLFPLLSTTNTEIIIANPTMNRVDKTSYIIDNPLTKKYLYVCWKELIVNKWPNSKIAKIKDNYLNCTRCDKCLRTLLAIDLFGKLDEYNGIFDIAYYRSIKDSYIAKVLLNKENSTFYIELQNLMRKVGYIPTKNVKRILFFKKHPFISRIYAKFVGIFKLMKK